MSVPYVVLRDACFTKKDGLVDSTMNDPIAELLDGRPTVRQTAQYTFLYTAVRQRQQDKLFA